MYFASQIYDKRIQKKHTAIQTNTKGNEIQNTLSHRSVSSEFLLQFPMDQSIQSTVKLDFKMKKIIGPVDLDTSEVETKKIALQQSSC